MAQKRPQIGKEWPEDGSPADFEDLTLPIRDAILFAYKVERQNEDKDVPYDGLPKGWHELVCSFPAKEALSAFQLRYSNDEQGRDALTEILAVLAHISFEQGRRIELEKISSYLGMLDIFGSAVKGIRSHFNPEREKT